MFKSVRNVISKELIRFTVVENLENVTFLKLRFLITSFTQVRELGVTAHKRHPRTKERTVNHDSTGEEDVICQAETERFSKKSTGSILKEAPWERGVWTPGSRRTGLICRKLGIYPLWTKTGKRIMTTALLAIENHVIKCYSPEEVKMVYPEKAMKRLGLSCLLVGAEDSSPEKYTSDYLDLFKESGVPPKKKLSRFFITPNAVLKPGTPLFASHFRPGDYVNVIGRIVDRSSKDDGYAEQNTNDFMTGDAMRSKYSSRTSPVCKLRPALRVWRVNTISNVIWVQGPGVPGPVNSWIIVQDTMSGRNSHKADNPPHFPTAYQEEWADFPEELYDDEIHRFSDPSVTFVDNSN